MGFSRSSFNSNGYRLSRWWLKRNSVSFKCKIKHLLADSFYFAQPKFCVGPKGLDTIDMRLLIRKLVAAMFNTIVLCITNIHKAMVATPSIRMNDAIQTDFAPYYRLQRTFSGIRNDFRVDQPLRLNNPNMIVLLPAPRPRFPRIRLGPK